MAKFFGLFCSDTDYDRLGSQTIPILEGFGFEGLSAAAICVNVVLDLKIQCC